jgi:hypothetical protein
MNVARQKQKEVGEPRGSGKKTTGRGSSKLSKAADKALGENSGRIVASLIESAASGHAVSAQLLVKLAEGPAENAKIDKTRRPRSWAKKLAAEPEWNGESLDADAMASAGQQ